MITFQEARKRILRHTRPLPANECKIQESLGCVIASSLSSPVNLPHFDNSAMDGFALSSMDTRKASWEKPVQLNIAGVLKAGSSKPTFLTRGHACRIMTGAPIPKGADAVLEKEKAVFQNGFLIIARPIENGRHVRRRSEEIKKSSGMDLRGTVVTPGVVGFLSALGLDRVCVHPKPRLSLVATGDELQPCGKKLGHGQIYDSNTPMLLAALKSLGISPRLAERIKDKKEALRSVLSNSLKQSDIVVLTGGVSVGDYDCVKEVFKEAGIRAIFWKVKQKPGKPVFFGRKGRVLVFGLPGNPASAHACFYEYVYPVIRRLMGHENVFLREGNPALMREIKPDPNKTLFLRAYTDRSRDRSKCEVLSNQGSHMLSPLCRSNGFMVVPPGSKSLKADSKVCFHYLPEVLPYEG